MTSTKDGVTVAKSINLEDPVEHMAITVLKEAAEKTAKIAGDGTTTSIVLSEALIKAANEMIDDTVHNRTEVLRNIELLSDEYTERLDKMSTAITPKMLQDVATISANNDEKVGKIVAAAYEKVGHDGIVNIEMGGTAMGTFFNEGITFKRGIMSEYQVTNQKARTIEYDNAIVLVTDKQIEDFFAIEFAVKHSVDSKRPLLIIGELKADAQHTLNDNIVRFANTGSKLLVANIQPPYGHGYKRQESLMDICRAIGATFISEKTGTNWSDVDESYLGSAAKVTVEKDNTTIIPSVENQDDWQEVVDELSEMVEGATNDSDKSDFEERLSIMSGQVATIVAGDQNDMVKKEIYDRLEDAVLACKAAIEDGIVPGGGTALLWLSREFDEEHEDDNLAVADDILGRACAAPIIQILRNAGKKEEDIVSILDDCNENIGYDVRAFEHVPMIDNGIVDPTKVTKTALKSAVGVATTILSTDTVVCNRVERLK
jgi:chaperonin GroEL